MIELLVWANLPDHIEASTVAICLTSLVGVKLCLWHLNLSPILSWGLNSGNRHKLHSLDTLHNGGQPHTALPGASTFCRQTDYQMGPTSTNATWWSVHKKNLLPHCIIPSHAPHTPAKASSTLMLFWLFFTANDIHFSSLLRLNAIPSISTSHRSRRVAFFKCLLIWRSRRLQTAIYFSFEGDSLSRRLLWKENL